MTRAHFTGFNVWLWICAQAVTALGQGAPPTKYVGRPLVEVLRELEAQRLNIVFSSELVRSDMRVVSEPKSTAPRKLLEEVLRPHGLEVRSGAGGSLMVVRSRRSAAPKGDRAGPTGRLSGTVVDARTSTPLPGVVIAVSGLDRETSTNSAGMFSLVDLPVGPVSLYVSLVGYGLARPIVDVRPNETSDVTIPLADGTGAYTESVTVLADTFRGTSSKVPAQYSLTSSEVSSLRGVLTDDPLRAIQALPSVSTGNDFRSEFSIRGSDFRHIGLSIDGIAISWPVHAIRDLQTIGSIAMLNGDIIDPLTLSQGTYPRQRPGRTGAWIDFTIREGTRARFELHGAVSATSASVVSDGPLGRAKRGSWLVSFRQSYLDWLLKRLDYQDATFGFTDAQAKMVFDVTPRQQVQLTAIAGRSQFDQAEAQPGPRSLSVGTGGSGLFVAGWRSTFGSSMLLTQRFAVTGSRFRNEGAVTPLLGNGSASEIAYHADVMWTPRPSIMIQTGTYLQKERETKTTTKFLETPTFTAGARRTESIDGSARMSSGDARLVVTAPNGIGLDAGIRVAKSTLTNQSTVTPWLLGVWPLGRGRCGPARAFPSNFPTLSR